MTDTNRKISEVLRRWIGPDKEISITEAAWDGGNISDDTVRNYCVGNTSPGWDFIWLMIRANAKRHPSFIVEMFQTGFFDGQPFVISYTGNQFDRDDLDADGDGKITKRDGAEFQHRAMQSEIEKARAISKGDNFEVIARIDPVIDTNQLKASAVMRIAQ